MVGEATAVLGDAALVLGVEGLPADVALWALEQVPPLCVLGALAQGECVAPVCMGDKPRARSCRRSRSAVRSVARSRGAGMFGTESVRRSRWGRWRSVSSGRITATYPWSTTRSRCRVWTWTSSSTGARLSVYR